jgi:hypothetical protein
MKNGCLGWIVFCALAATQGCRASSPDWNGTWKLNFTRSTFPGQVLTVSVSADGEYRFDEHSRYALRCDGKDRAVGAVGNGRTLVCAKSGVTVLEITQKENGVKTRVTRDELSSDGKVFTTTVIEFRSNGPVVTSKIVFSRLSGSSGFVGQWRDTSYLQLHADMILRLDDRALHIDYPGAGEQIDAPLDGVEAAVRGRRILEGATCAVRPAGNREFLIVTKHQGKVFSQGSFELSKDGGTISNSWWIPERPGNKGTLVYEKR